MVVKMSETTAAQAVKAGRGEPGFFIIIRPDRLAYSILRRMALASTRERTSKDFVDFLGNVGVMVHFGPLTGALLADEESCRELIPECRRKMDAAREVYTGGMDGRQYMIIFLTDSLSRDELPRWKELVRWIVERFY